MPESSLTVLVVSDDKFLSSEIVYAFPSGVDVLLAHDAREAWAIMKETVPSVAVIEIRTRSAGGYGLSSDMRANERLAGVPRLVLLERPQDSWLALQAGATAYRVKPLEGGELVSTVLSLASEPAPS